MAKARALDKRRKSIRNIRKITRTMELIATAKFQQAMDRASSASAYTDRITQLVADVLRSGTEVRHPLLEERTKTDRVVLLVLTGNRGMCGGYNGNVQRMAVKRHAELVKEFPHVRLEVSGKRGISTLTFQGLEIEDQYRYTQFDDKPRFEEVDVLASRFLQEYIGGEFDRLEVVYTKMISHSKQQATVETLLPLGSIAASESKDGGNTTKKESSTAADDGGMAASDSMVEFLPSAESIIEEVVPTSFKVKLFKFFLDAAVSEQIARMIAMKAATENADDMIRHLSMTYNRARQSQITGEIMEIISGVEAMGG